MITVRKSSEILKENLRDHTSKKYKLSPLSGPIEIFMNTTRDTALEYVFVFDSAIKLDEMKFISLSCYKNEEGKYYHHFELNEPIFEEQFHVLFDDIINYLTNFSTSEEAARAFEDRFIQWIILLQKGFTKSMSLESVKGLIGELIILEKLLESDKEHIIILNGWEGPQNGHKDFVYEDVWYETKCLNSNAKKVKISSFEQLESKNDGILATVILTNSQPYLYRITLNELIGKVKNKLVRIEHKLLFLRILANTSIVFSDELCDKEFFVKNIKYYIVNDEFPKITRSDVPAEIDEGNYSIILRLIDAFICEENNVWG